MVVGAIRPLAPCSPGLHGSSDDLLVRYRLAAVIATHHWPTFAFTDTSMALGDGPRPSPAAGRSESRRPSRRDSLRPRGAPAAHPGPGCRHAGHAIVPPPTT